MLVFKNAEEIFCPNYAGNKRRKPLEIDFIIMSSAHRSTLHSRTMENSVEYNQQNFLHYTSKYIV